MHKSLTFFFVLIFGFGFTSAHAWSIDYWEDPISGDTYEGAYISSFGKTLGVVCAHEGDERGLFIVYMSDYVGNPGEHHTVEYRIGDYTRQSDWIVHNDKILLAPAVETDDIIDEFIEADTAYFRSQTEQLTEFDIEGGEQEIEHVISVCQ